MSTVILNPFTDEQLDEVRLEPAPLVKVVAQLRFPAVASIAHQAFISPFQEQLRGRYPVLRQEQEMQAVIAPQGIMAESSTVWRLHDVSGEWSVGLAPSSVSLETTSYSNRDDFIERLGEIFGALQALGEPPHVIVFDRLGVRYINRLTGDDATTDSLRRFVRDEVYGPLTIEMPDGMNFLASIAQAHFALDGPQMQARWGRLPPGGAFLPGVEPVNEASWMLDVDVFIEGPPPREFNAAEATEMARHASAHAYRFFMWAMRSEFIEPRIVS